MFDQVITHAASLILFIIAQYLIFFRKFTETIAVQKGELRYIKEKTIEIESVKKSFNEDLEKFKKGIQLDLAGHIEHIKATLGKENITHQIFNSEYIRLRFQRLDDLHSKLYELKKYCEENLFHYKDEEDFRAKKDGFKQQNKNAEDAYYKAVIYIQDESVSESIIDFLTVTNKAYFEFNMFYQSDPNQNKFIFQSKDENLITASISRNNYSLEKIHDYIGNLPSLLGSIQMEFRRHLTLPSNV